MPDTAGDNGAAHPRPRFTSRAAVLVVVVCAIALSLAYPVREYIAQLRQISQMQAEQAQVSAQLRQLRAESRALATPAYVEQQARDRLHMCLPTQTCYIIINGTRPPARAAVVPGAAATPWYERLWSSVHQADKVSGR